MLVSHIGVQVYYKTQGNELKLGRIIAEYPRYVLIETEFGYRTCVHKGDLLNGRK